MVRYCTSIWLRQSLARPPLAESAPWCFCVQACVRFAIRSGGAEWARKTSTPHLSRLDFNAGTNNQIKTRLASGRHADGRPSCWPLLHGRVGLPRASFIPPMRPRGRERFELGIESSLRAIPARYTIETEPCE